MFMYIADIDTKVGMGNEYVVFQFYRKRWIPVYKWRLSQALEHVKSRRRKYDVRLRKKSSGEEESKSRDGGKK